MMKLIVGLGNPGPEYDGTRHNAGFFVVDKIAADERFTPWKKNASFNALVCRGNIVTETALLAKPQTFMNLSGEAVLKISQYYKIHPRDILVIHDDLDLPCASIRISQNASSGGHKGVQSIIDCLKTREFARFRLGIAGNAAGRVPAEEYVLQKFSSVEKIKIDSATSLLIEAIERALTNGVLEAMNEFN